MSTSLKVFCCYAREDQAMLEQLKKHLMPLQRQGLITIWSDTNINAGVEWEKELHQHLESADIILLLISPDFMSSDYCYSTEMSRAIERHNEGSTHVIPVLLRFTYWQTAPFAKLQIVPTNAQPITNWSDSDQAFHNITEQINRVITGQETLSSNPSSPTMSLQQTLQSTPQTSLLSIGGEWDNRIYPGISTYLVRVQVSGWGKASKDAYAPDFLLFLNQIGTKITGTGNIGGNHNGYNGSLTVTGSIHGASINLKTTPVEKGSSLTYYEMTMILIPPREMRGHYIEYKRGLFKKANEIGEIRFLRKESSNEK